MKKYFLLLFLVLIVSCGENTNTVYDYTNETSTLFLNVTPQELVFTPEDKNVELKDFKMSFDTNELTLLSMDIDKSSSKNFNVSVDNTKCMEETASNGECIIKVGITNNIKDGDSGTIILSFFYNNDMQAEPQSIKTHKLVYRYTQPAPKP